MAVLGFDVILKYKDELFLKYTFSESCLELASYTLRVGTEKMIVDGIYYEHYLDESIHIPPQQKALLSTFEILNLPMGITGEIFLRRAHSTRGLSLEGRHIDPLYKGRVSLILRNETDSPITLLPMDTIAILRLQEVRYLEPHDDALLKTLENKYRKTFLISGETIESWEKLKVPEIISKLSSHDNSLENLVMEHDRLEQSIKAETSYLREAIHNANTASQYAVWAGVVLVSVTILGVVLQTIFAAWNSSLNISASLSQQQASQEMMRLIWMPVIVTFLFMVFIFAVIVVIAPYIRRRSSDPGKNEVKTSV